MDNVGYAIEAAIKVTTEDTRSCNVRLDLKGGSLAGGGPDFSVSLRKVEYLSWYSLWYIRIMRTVLLV